LNNLFDRDVVLGTRTRTRMQSTHTRSRVLYLCTAVCHMSDLPCAQFTCFHTSLFLASMYLFSSKITHKTSSQKDSKAQRY